MDGRGVSGEAAEAELRGKMKSYFGATMTKRQISRKIEEHEEHRTLTMMNSSMSLVLMPLVSLLVFVCDLC